MATFGPGVVKLKTQILVKKFNRLLPEFKLQS